MFQEMMPMSTGGGAPSGAKGEKDVSVSTEYDIDTGLSEITTFSLCGAGALTSGSSCTITYYDARRSTTLYMSGAGSAQVTMRAFGASGAGTHLNAIVSITGGTVRIKTASSDNMLAGKIYWSAT